MKFPKPNKIRSKKIKESAKGESCTFNITGVCNHDNKTVVFCHAPSPNKGTSTKTDDYWGAYGCSNCHDYVDNHSTFETAEYWLIAIFRTSKKLIKKGLIQIL